MADLLSIGTSGIRVYQRSLATLGNNIANVDTQGYSRQEHETRQDIGTSQAGINIGLGVTSKQVARAYDAFATSALRSNTSSLEQQEALYAYAMKLENIVGDQSVSVTTALDRFFESAHELSMAPASAGARGALLNEATNVVERFQSLSRQFNRLDDDSFIEIDSRVNELNTLSRQLAAVNNSLFTASDVDLQPGALLDQRDLLLQEISVLAKIGISEHDNGVVDVYLGDADSGNAIVIQDQAKELTASRIENAPERVAFILDPYGAKRTVSGLGSGKIAGIEDFRNNALAQIRKELDEIAVSFMGAVNKVQQSGLDSSNDPGRAMFGLVGGSEGTGRAAMDIRLMLNGGDEIATGAPLMVDQHGSSVTFNLLNWDTPGEGVLRNAEESIADLWIADPGSSASSFSAASPPLQAFVIEGNKVRDLDLRIDQGGGAQVQVFTRDGRHVYGSDPDDPTKGFDLADLMTAGNGFDTGVAGYNGDYRNASGSASYRNALEVADLGGDQHQLKLNGQINDDLLVFVTAGTADFSGGWFAPEEALAKEQLLSGVRIDFTGSDSYKITDTSTNTHIATRSYAPGDLIEVNGWSANLQNIPSAGDSFSIARNTAARGDNRNVLALVELQADRTVFQGRGNFSEVYADVINEVGSVVMQASISRDAQEVLTDEARDTRDSVSGVSLDEEAADLLRFQQAYQANAQVIQAANRLFDAILNIR